MRRTSTGTDVPVARTRGELIELLTQWGSTQYAVATNDDGAVRVVFTLEGRQIRLELKVDSSKLPLADKDVDNQPPGRFAPKNMGWDRWTKEKRNEYIKKIYGQCEREAWRRLLLVTKARLEQTADSSVERVFLADILTVNGQTVYDQLQNPLAEMYKTGKSLRLLPAHSEK